MNLSPLFQKIAALAVDALIEEALLSPKPGLVDAYDCGSHTDMDAPLFVKSAHSFSGSFYAYLLCGFTHDDTEKSLLLKIRTIGIKAEAHMFDTTGHINTHKGANFTFGLFLGSLGFFLQHSSVSQDIPLSIVALEGVFAILEKMTTDLVATDFKNLDQKKSLSYGEQLYVRYHLTGIRGEAQQGYPSIRNGTLPQMKRLFHHGIAKDQCYLQLLFILMTTTEDSNVVARGGVDALGYVKQCARQFLERGGVFQKDAMEQIQQLNHDFKQRRLSPGGSADLLAFTIFLGTLLGYCFETPGQ